MFYYLKKRYTESLVCLLLVICFIAAPRVAQGLMSSVSRSKAATINSNVPSRGFVSSSAEEISKQNDAWKGFFQRYGSDFSLLSASDSANVHRILGGDIKLDLPRGFTGTIDVTQGCVAFIQQNLGIFGLSQEDIRHRKSAHRGGMWFVDFEQFYHGVPVYGGKISFILSESGDVLSITMNHFPGIDLPEPGFSDADLAEGVARTDLAYNHPSQDLGLLERQLVVYPIQDQDNVRFAWAWHFEFKYTQPIEKWQYIVEAETGVILNKKRLGRFMVSGEVKGQVLPRYSEDNPVEISLPNLEILCLRNDPPLMYESLDFNPGWLGTNPAYAYGWNFGQPLSYPLGGAGGPGPETGHTGATFYGFSLDGYYPLNMWASEYLTTNTAINCSGKKNIYLRFWRWLGVEGSESDSASLEIADGPSSTWWKVWTNPEENIYDGGWKLILYDISKWADDRDNIFLRWGMGPTNGYVSYCGWNLDDIGVYTSTKTFSDQDGNYEITGEASKNILSSYLNGKYFKVINEDGANVIYTRNDVSSGGTGQNMHFTRVTDYDVSTKTGTVNALSDIDEINVYYHANRLVEYIQDIDPYFWAEDSEYLPIPITVRYDVEYTNSFWMPGDGIYFGEGDKLEFGNFAHFADIIYHECTHAITDSIYDNMDTLSKGLAEGGYAALARFSEFDAMHEAFSDYWACTITNDSKIAEGGFWIDHDCVRDLDNDLNYLINYGLELYQSSQILSGAMWDLRQALRQENGDAGIRIADTLFHFARLAQPTTYLDFLVNTLIVDQVSYQSAHEQMIKETFGKRGISQAPAPPSSVIVTIQNQGANLQWNQSSDAIGYNLYYGPSSTSRLLNDTRYMQSGDSSDRTEGGDRTDGGGGMDGGSSSSSSSTNQTNPQTTNPTNIQTTASKIDVGNTTQYYLTGLDTTVTYRVQLTSYNIYGVESSLSEEALIPSTSSAIPTSGTGVTWGDTDGTGMGMAQGVTCFISSCE